MSVITLLVPFAVAIIAMLIRAAILQNWTAQHLAADFFYALAIVLLPVVLHA